MREIQGLFWGLAQALAIGKVAGFLPLRIYPKVKKNFKYNNIARAIQLRIKDEIFLLIFYTAQISLLKWIFYFLLFESVALYFLPPHTVEKTIFTSFLIIKKIKPENSYIFNLKQHILYENNAKPHIYFFFLCNEKLNPRWMHESRLKQKEL